MHSTGTNKIDQVKMEAKNEEDVESLMKITKKKLKSGNERTTIKVYKKKETIECNKQLTDTCLYQWYWKRMSTTKLFELV